VKIPKVQFAELIHILLHQLSTLSIYFANFGFDMLSFRSRPDFLGTLIRPTYVVETFIDGGVGSFRSEEFFYGIVSVVGGVLFSLSSVLHDDLLEEEWLLA
jgi:hypothetical protein